jgi:hypothetical protein
MKEKIYAWFGMILLAGLLILPLVNSQIATQLNSVCCEQTNSGMFCQNVPATECKAGVRQVPTSCETTSYCKPGVCYSSLDGTCTDNTPQLVCNANNGVWSAQEPPQCGLGCCVLGDQAAFVTLVRCKKLASALGLKTNYKTDLKNEVDCVLSVQNQEKGACVYEFEFERTCKFTTRAECSGSGGEGNVKGEFFAGKLCSAEELGTNCGPSTKTTCLPGKEEVYFLDTCGNPANIYDSSKIKNQEYWSEIKGKTESCNPNGNNAKSSSCGNCNYLLGSICRGKDTAGGKPTYGDYMCADLNCKKTSNGDSYKHGESWCIDKDNKDPSAILKKVTGQIATIKTSNSVGSKGFKHICVGGEEKLETCADFKQEVCIEDNIEIGSNKFSQAACRVNRWQDCFAQDEQDDCENADKRDCYWYGISSDVRKAFGLGNVNQSSGEQPEGVCLPQIAPGLNFWTEGDAETICAQANAKCIVKLQKGLFGDEYECDEEKDEEADEEGEETQRSNCECWDNDAEDVSSEWKNEHIKICKAIGDCGPRINWVGSKGYGDSYEISVSKLKKSDVSGEKSGLF